MSSLRGRIPVKKNVVTFSVLRMCVIQNFLLHGLENVCTISLLTHDELFTKMHTIKLPQITF